MTELLIVTDATYSPQTGVTGRCAYVELTTPDTSQFDYETTQIPRKTGSLAEAEAVAMLAGLDFAISLLPGWASKIGKGNVKVSVYCDAPEVVDGIKGGSAAAVHRPKVVEVIHSIRGAISTLKEELAAMTGSDVEIQALQVGNRNGSFAYPELIHSKCAENAFIQANL